MKKLKKIKIVGLKEILVKHKCYTSKKIEQDEQRTNLLLSLKAGVVC